MHPFHQSITHEKETREKDLGLALSPSALVREVMLIATAMAVQRSPKYHQKAFYASI